MKADAYWWDATITTGRVIAVEWLKEKGENRLRINYGYRDNSGTIYHSTGILARKRGKLNLEPGAYVAVLYRPDDHSQSRLAIEVGRGEWITLSGIGALEILVGIIFLAAARRRRRKSPDVEGTPEAAAEKSSA
jgi:hypothetical protein